MHDEDYKEDHQIQHLINFYRITKIPNPTSSSQVMTQAVLDEVDKKP
jgi:hypothetical protein